MPGLILAHEDMRCHATGPGDITWLPGPIAGVFFYLYLIVDIFSRKIVGWEVHDRETAEFASPSPGARGVG